MRHGTWRGWLQSTSIGFRPSMIMARSSRSMAVDGNRAASVSKRFYSHYLSIVQHTEMIRAGKRTWSFRSFHLSMWLETFMHEWHAIHWGLRGLEDKKQLWTVWKNWPLVTHWTSFQQWNTFFDRKKKEKNARYIETCSNGALRWRNMGRSDVISLGKFCEVIEKMLESGWEVATAS